MNGSRDSLITRPDRRSSKLLPVSRASVDRFFHVAGRLGHLRRAWWMRWLNTMKPFSLMIGAALLAASGSICDAEQLVYHDIKTDSSGKIVPWYGSGPSQAYDHVVRLLFNFWKDMRKCPNGVPMYMQHQVWKSTEEDPRGLGGDQISMALSSWNLLYGYLGEAGVRDNMAYMADYWLTHGLSAKNDQWGRLPYPYNTDAAFGRLRRRHAGRQGIPATR